MRRDERRAEERASITTLRASCPRGRGEVAPETGKASGTLTQDSAVVNVETHSCATPFDRSVRGRIVLARFRHLFLVTI